MDLSLSQVAVWAFTAWGITQIVTQSKLFRPLANGYPGQPGLFPPTPPGEPIRSFRGFIGSLVTCSMCFGMWVGIALHLSGKGLYDSHWVKSIGQPMSLQTISTLANGVLTMVCDGAAASAACEGADVLTRKLER